MTTEERRIDLKRKYAIAALCFTTFIFGFSLGSVTVNERNEVPEIVEQVEIETEERQEVEEVYEEPTPMYDFTEPELEYFAKVIYAEYGTSREGMVLCGSVILNRIESKKFPNDLVDVITQKNAFSTAYTKKEPSEEAMEIARLLAMDGSVLPKEVLYFRLYQPVENTIEYTRCGSVVFSYDEF